MKRDSTHTQSESSKVWAGMHKNECEDSEVLCLEIP